jgi:tetratricopeptide (TPR) repeat protein
MRVLTLVILVSTALPAAAETLPEWYLPLREAVYEQVLTVDGIAPLFRQAMGRAQESLSGPELYVMLSRCEYMMGRAYQNEERKQEAADRYEQGMNWAQKALDERPGAEAWQMLAENLSQSCAVRPASFAMANGLKVEKYAKNALALDSRNAAAQYMIAARWVFAPAPFHNYRRGIEMMSAILSEGDMGRDDEFNVYSAIGYTYVQQKKYGDARPWLLKSLELYPTNKFVLGLLAKS